MIYSAAQPMEMNLMKSGGDFKFCPLADSYDGQPWSAVAKYDDGTEKKMAIDHSLYGVSYETPEYLGL